MFFHVVGSGKCHFDLAFSASLRVLDPVLKFVFFEYRMCRQLKLRGYLVVTISHTHTPFPPFS